MRKALIGLVAVLVGCAGGAPFDDGANFQAALQPDEVGSVTFDATWDMFPREMARIKAATTPQEWEDAINAHPRAGKKKHRVKGAFGRAIPDCHVTSLNLTGASHLSSPTIYIDGSNHANDRVITYYNDGTNGDQVAAFDDTCTKKWASPTQNGPIQGYVWGDYTYFGAVDTGGYMTVWDYTGREVDAIYLGASTSHMTPWFEDETGLGCSTCGNHAIYVTDTSGVLTKLHIDVGDDAIYGDWTYTLAANVPSHTLPVVVSGHVFAANDKGNMYIVSNDGSLQAGPTCMASGGSCSSPAATDAVWAYPVFDIGSGNGDYFYYQVSNKILRYTYSSTNGCSKTGSACTLQASATHESTQTLQASGPRLDINLSTGATNYVIAGYRGKVYRYAPGLGSSTSVAVNDLTTGASTQTVSRFGKTLSNPVGDPAFLGVSGGHTLFVLGDSNGRLNIYYTENSTSISRHGSYGAGGSTGSWDGVVTCSSIDETPTWGSTGATQYMYVNCKSGSNAATFVSFDPFSL